MDVIGYGHTVTFAIAAVVLTILWLVTRKPKQNRLYEHQTTHDVPTPLETAHKHTVQEAKVAPSHDFAPTQHSQSPLDEAEEQSAEEEATSPVTSSDTHAPTPTMQGSNETKDENSDPELSRSDEGYAIVVDCGSCTCRVGFAGEESPRAVFPSVVGRPKYNRVMIDAKHKDIYVGDEVESMRGALSIV